MGGPPQAILVLLQLVLVPLKSWRSFGVCSTSVDCKNHNLFSMEVKTISVDWACISVVKHQSKISAYFCKTIFMVNMQWVLHMGSSYQALSGNELFAIGG